LADRHRHEPVIWPADVSQSVPSWLRHVVEVCLAKRPEHRFESAAALGEALRCGVDVTTLVPRAGDPEAPGGIVVRTFKNLSRQPEDDWIGDAVAEYLGSRLLDVSGLRVVDRHGLDKVLGDTGGDATPVDEARLIAKARMLGAGVVVVGSFQRNRDQIRISAHSIGDPPGQRERFNANVAGRMDDLFSLEDELARGIIESVGRGKAAVSIHGHAGGTDSLEAHEKFIRGRRAFADGSYQSAIRLAEEALAEDSTYIDAVSLIGASYARIGDYDRALEYHQKEESVARGEGDRRRLAEALGNLGVMYYYRGDYGAAYEFLVQARDLCTAASLHPDTAKYAGNLGFVLMRLDRYEEAEEAFASAIEIHKKYGDLVSLCWPYNGMGGVLLKQKRYAEASEYYSRALGLANEIGDRVNIGVSHMNLGRCACLLQDYAEAEASFDEALRALEGTDFWNGLTLVYEHMADMYLQERNVPSAMSCIDRRLELAQKHDNNRMQAEAWEQKAKAHELAGERDKAFECLKRSIEVSQRPAPHQSLQHYLSEIATRKPFS
jgi:tetratricopeptide (TPR) repeat protein